MAATDWPVSSLAIARATRCASSSCRARGGAGGGKPHSLPISASSRRRGSSTGPASWKAASIARSVWLELP